MLLRYSYTTLITFSSKVADHTFAARCIPYACSRQKIVEERSSVVPYCPLSRGTDSFGNAIVSGYIGRRHDVFAFEARGVVETGGALAPESANSLFLYPSELTLPSVDITRAVASLGPVDDVDLWVARLMDLLGDRVAYRSGVTSVATSSADAWDLRAGVCQDFAHIAVTMCRLVGVPARYVCGLMIGEGASHAWVEYYSGGVWKAFDPTNHVFVSDGYIKLAHGRDYQDCSISRGSFRGCAEQKVVVDVDVWAISPLELQNGIATT